ncbi:hypothetical protein [Acinetobacter ursingii]|uniref:hypothetical protein n=1 Tax=Acinetobacter ursingii TaxID=108980 RepID=UPI000E6ADD87|nr:hypothetical protein [Acinetobacter ursingii]
MPYYIKKNNRYLTLENITNEHYDDEYNIVNESLTTGFNWTVDLQYAKSFYDYEEAERYVYQFSHVLKDVQIVQEKF